MPRNGVIPERAEVNLMYMKFNTSTDLEREQAKKENARRHELKAKGYSPYVWTSRYVNTNTVCNSLSPCSREEKIVPHLQLIKYESITPTATYRKMGMYFKDVI